VRISNAQNWNHRLWLQKGVLLAFYKRLVEHLEYGGRAVRAMQVILVLTFIAAFVVTFTECRPFNHYWIVMPLAGTVILSRVPVRGEQANCSVLSFEERDECIRANIQLFVVGPLAIPIVLWSHVSDSCV
jgi:peptidoglycan/LPS O-acetylase OafA/YrhL